MACTSQTLSGLVNDCLSSMGGITDVWLINRDDIGTFSVSDGKVKNILDSTGVSALSAAKIHHYYFRRNTGSMTSTYTFDATNGSRYVTTDLTMLFMRMDTTKRIEVSAMAANDLAAIVKDANGTLWVLGRENAVVASAGDGQTGTAVADRNGYSITLEDTSLEMPYELDGSSEFAGNLPTT